MFSDDDVDGEPARRRATAEEADDESDAAPAEQGTVPAPCASPVARRAAPFVQRGTQRQ